MKNKILKLMIGVMALALASGNAMAVLISGEIAYGGLATLSGSSLTILNPVSASGTGDLSGVTSITHVSPLSIPAPGGAIGTPLLLWSDASAATTNFLLDSGSRTDNGTGSTTLAGFGTMSMDGFDPTAYTWSLSYDPTASIFFFSAAQAAVVPEPGIIGLLGLGLLGIGGVRRMKKIA